MPIQLYSDTEIITQLRALAHDLRWESRTDAATQITALADRIQQEAA
ncbi:hypothetical protein IU449_26920 [Nocardia higoensis]|uniref:Uncharacterized protein n=1 Tax=Nocardia higoensis TaxID=228599 RepID=A0ABS0DI38_9NOCA|nr:hypothetical protein [Nocardia higoensis]MBF6358133.1 hypothetical protein [Nocardia higoensis]